jgi:oxygen-dependent protoporphyrinogen oxidase
VATTHSVIVVGAGISGLACAYALKKSGEDVLVLESSKRPGGVIRTVSKNGYLLETGPQSFSTTAALTALIRDLKLSDQLAVAPPHAPRYILAKGRLRPVPLSPPALLGSSLLSWATRFSLLREPFRKTIPPSDDESIADFVRRRFSSELLELLAGPFVSGIYAGDPEKLSLRAAFPQIHEAEERTGSIIRGMKAAAKARTNPQGKPTLASFRNGNETLPRALFEALGDSIRTGTQVMRITCDSDQQFNIAATGDSGSVQFHTSRLVVATPTEAAASLLQELAPSAAEALSQIAYAPVAVVSLGYCTADVSHPLNGFGFLVPRSSGLRILGTVWNSSLFPDRAPQDHVVVTSFLGGATDPTTASLSETDLAELVQKELDPLLGFRLGPDITHVTKYERAIPQYNLGHLDRLAAIRSGLAKIPGLHLTGNFFKGPAIGACVEQAQAVAESIRMR